MSGYAWHPVPTASPGRLAYDPTEAMRNDGELAVHNPDPEGLRPWTQAALDDSLLERATSSETALSRYIGALTLDTASLPPVSNSLYYQTQTSQLVTNTLKAHDAQVAENSQPFFLVPGDYEGGQRLLRAMFNDPPGPRSTTKGGLRATAGIRRSLQLKQEQMQQPQGEKY